MKLMSRNVAATIALVALMVLTVLASLYAAQPAPSTSSLNVSPQPIHSTHPMIPAPVPPSPQISSAQKASQGCSLPAAQCWASYNWGGYAVTGPTSSVTDVKGSWTVPAVVPSVGATCLDTQVTWFDASFWVGIDGFSSNTVEQTGTSSDCFYGQVSYYAWYEFYPAGSVTIQSLTLNPGDRITAEVKYSNGVFTTTITDLTTKQTFTSPATAVPGAEENSGEWIAESALASQGILALTDFISVTFTNDYATVGTHSGISQPITAFGSNLQWIEMINYNWPTIPGVKGSPSALTLGLPCQKVCQKSFNVNWVSSGP